MSDNENKDKLSISECRKYIASDHLSDEQIVQLRDALYFLSDISVEALLEGEDDKISSDL